jgi:hypothetical protein
VAADNWVFGLSPSSGIRNNTSFGKLDLFSYADEEDARRLLC